MWNNYFYFFKIENKKLNKVVQIYQNGELDKSILYSFTVWHVSKEKLEMTHVSIYANSKFSAISDSICNEREQGMLNICN